MTVRELIVRLQECDQLDEDIEMLSVDSSGAPLQLVVDGVREYMDGTVVLV
jgi:hypothetical protein